MTWMILSLCIGMAMLGFLSAELLYRGKLKDAAKWRDGVLDHLANACIDAPLTEHPRDIVQRIIDVHVAIALDPTINGGYKLVPIGPSAKVLAAGDGWCQFPRETWASMLHVVDPTSDALPLVDGVPTIDLDAVAWHDIKKAASESTWMPPEYMANDWQADVESFLRNGPVPDGYAMVPIEPTEEMHREAVGAAVALQSREPWFPVAWKTAIKIATEKKA